MKTKSEKRPATPSSGAISLPMRRRALNLAILALLYPSWVTANPEGAEIVSGQVTIDASKPGVMTVTNSPNAIVNWQNFNIAQHELTQFIQQNSQSAILNRIVGQNPSEILGSLISNGQVLLINPYGIVFGANATIDTQGLIASSLNLSDKDFLTGNYHFIAGSTAGNITNEGIIRAGKDGNIVLIAPQINNNGIIKTDGGSITLAAGQELIITSLDDPSIRFQIQAPGNAALNLGKLLTDGGAVNVFANSIKHSGEINADSVEMDAQGNIRLVAQQDITLTTNSKVSANSTQGHAGEIVIDSKAGTTTVEGTLEAKAEPASMDDSQLSSAKGGSIAVLGEQVTVRGNTRIDASGKDGGGSVLVGGDYQGNNAVVHNAKTTTVEQGTVIKADALKQGDGGKVIVWSDQNTKVQAAISAKGGSVKGDGGLVETSGHHLAVDGATVNASATHGKAGQWLLDPNNVVIQSAGQDTRINVGTGTGSGIDYTSFADNSVITTGTLLAALDAGTDVTISTSSSSTSTQEGNITLSDPLAKTGANDSTLTLNAHNTIAINAAVTSNNSKLNLNLNPDSDNSGAGIISITDSVELNNGTLALNGDTNLSGTIKDASVNLATGKALTSTNGIFDGVVTLVSDMAVTSGTLNLNGDVIAQGALTVKGSVVNINGSFDSAGDLNINSSGSLNFNNPSPVTLNHTLNLSDAGSHLGGSGDLEIKGSFNWSDGASINGTGKLTTSATTVISGQGNEINRQWNNAGTVNVINNSSLLVTDVSPVFSNNTSITGAGNITFNVKNELAVPSIEANTLAIASTNNVYLTGNITVGSDSLFQVKADGNITVNDNVTITGNGNRLNTVLNADADGNDAGYILLNTGSSIATNGGDLALGGGSDPLVKAAYGVVGNPYGVQMKHVTLDTGVGNISIRGAAPSGESNAVGVLLESSTKINTTSGNIEIVGTGSDADFSTSVKLTASGIRTTTGNLSITGTGISTSNNSIGVELTGDQLVIGGALSITATGEGASGDITQDSGTISNRGDNGDLTASQDVTLTGNNITLADVRSQRQIIINAQGDVTLSASSGRDFVDDQYFVYNLPSDFNFSFYGTSYSQFYISSNGLITFGSGTTDYADDIASLADYKAIAPAWNDWVLYSTSTDRNILISRPSANELAVQWNAKHYSSDNTAIFEAVLSDTGKITFNYGAASDSFTDDVTIGLSNGSGASVIQSQLMTGFAGMNNLASTVFTPSGSTYNEFIQETNGVLSTSSPIYSGADGFAVHNNTLEAVSDISITATGDITQSDLPAESGGNILLSAGGNYFNTVDGNAFSLTGTGRWLIFSSDPASNALNALIANFKHYDCTAIDSCSGFSIPNAGNGLLYSLQPELTVSPSPGVVGSQYGEIVDLSAVSKTINGYVDGDDEQIAGVSGSAVYTTTATTKSAVGKYDIEYSGGLTNALGYKIVDDVGSTNEYEITPRVLTLTGSRVYDGSLDVSAGHLALKNLLPGETLTLAGAGALLDKNVGNDKPLSIGTLTLGNGGNGGLASNYFLGISQNLVSITPALLTASASAPDKVYDGNKSANPSLNIRSGLVSGETVQVTATGQFNSKDVKTANQVTVDGVSLSDGTGLASNYQLLPGQTAVAHITPALLTASASAPDKIYDGNKTANPSLNIISGLVSGETVQVTATGQFNSKDVKTANQVTVDGVSLSDGTGLASNYQLLPGQTAVAHIKPALLTANASAPDKIYDGNKSASPSLNIISGLVSGETVQVTATGQFNSKDVKTANQVTVDGVSLSDGTGLASNYQLLPGQTAVAHITPALLTASASAPDKIYDGNKTANPSLNVISGLVSGESVQVTATGQFNSKDVKTANQVTVDGVSLSDGTGLASNYQLLPGQTAVAHITPALLTASASAPDKVYDGNKSANPSLNIRSGLVSGETVQVTATGQFNSKDVKTANQVTVDGVSLSDGTGLASNYQLLPGQTAVAHITPALLTASASAPDKVYDGNKSANPSLNIRSGLVSGETVQVTATGQFNSKDVKTANQVTVDGVSLSDGTGLASNYQLLPGQTAVAHIKPALLTANASAPDKIYDGNKSASPSLNIISGLVSGETVQVTATGQFNSKDVKTANQVTVDGVSLSDGTGLASNYQLLPGQTAVAHITPALLTASASAPDKIYDGNKTANPSLNVISGLVSGESVQVTATGQFNSKDVKTANQVTVDGVSLSDGTGLASNYQLLPGQTAVAHITPALLTASASAPDKVYDGNKSANPSLNIRSGLVSGETVQVTATGQFNSKDVKTANQVTVDGVSLSDGTGLASNYQLLPGQTAVAHITPALLTASASAPDKIYDGNKTANPSLNITSGLVSGETVQVTATGQFNSKDVKTANQVTVDGVSLSDGTGLASNYQLLPGQTAVAHIKPALLTANASAPDKIYDGNKSASPSLNIISGLVSGETVQVTATGQFNSKDVKTANQVTVDGVSLSDGTGLASNYQLLPGQTAVAHIKPALLTANASAPDKIYDGNKSASPSLNIISGLVSGETVQVTATGQFNSKDVKTANQVTVDGVSLSDGTGLASNYQLLPGQTAVAHITPALLTASASAPDKIYDGNKTANPSLNVISGLVSGESVQVTATGQFNSKDVKTANQVTVDGVSLSDGTGLASNYQLLPGQTAVAHITPALLTASASAPDKVYDGNKSANPSLNIRSGLVSGETVQVTATGQFNSKDVKTANQVTVDGVSLSDGTGLASNYSLGYGQRTTARITQALSVQWSQDSIDQDWFNAQNWTGGVIPDSNNVLNVYIPSGKTVDYDDTGKLSVNLSSLKNDGTFNMKAGDFLATSFSTMNYQQTGGNIAVVNDISINGSFSQTGGTLNANAGDINITSKGAEGFVQSGGFLSATKGDITVTTSGDFTQSGDTISSDGFAQKAGGSIEAAAGKVTLTAGGLMDLSGTVSGNIGEVTGTSNTNSLELTADKFTQSVGSLSATTGDISVTSSGDFTQSGGSSIEAAKGNISLTAGNILQEGESASIRAHAILDVNAKSGTVNLSANKNEAGEVKVTAIDDVDFDATFNDYGNGSLTIVSEKGNISHIDENGIPSYSTTKGFKTVSLTAKYGGIYFENEGGFNLASAIAKNDISVTANSPLTIGGVQNVVTEVTAGGNITLASMGEGGLSIAGGSTVDSENGNISLSSADPEKGISISASSIISAENGKLILNSPVPTTYKGTTYPGGGISEILGTKLQTEQDNVGKETQKAWLGSLSSNTTSLGLNDNDSAGSTNETPSSTKSSSKTQSDGDSDDGSTKGKRNKQCAK